MKKYPEMKRKYEMTIYRSQLDKRKSEFKDYLASVSRYLTNKRLKTIKYYG